MKPLVDQKYKLEKFPGKGGWTFIRIPEVLQSKNSPFGWVKVRVLIDAFEMKKYRLMPMGNGQLFLPVRAEIRKKIGKKEGDTAHVTLYPDDEELEIPEELLLCLRDEPMALRYFDTLSEDEKEAYVRWIYAAKNEKTRIERLAAAVDRLAEKKRFNGRS